MKPVSKPIISTALELDLQEIDALLDVTASGHVRVLVVAHGVLQTRKQSRFQVSAHGVAHQSSQQDAEGEEKGTRDVRQYEDLPVQELVSVHAVVADLPTQEVDAAGGQAHGDQHVWHRIDLVGH